MESLGSILGSKKFTPPDEMLAVKDYIEQRYSSSCSVSVEKNAVIISVPNSALAGTLRMEQRELIKKCKLGDKRLIIRIGR